MSAFRKRKKRGSGGIRILLTHRSDESSTESQRKYAAYLRSDPTNHLAEQGSQRKYAAYLHRDLTNRLAEQGSQGKYAVYLRRDLTNHLVEHTEVWKNTQLTCAEI